LKRANKFCKNAKEKTLFLFSEESGPKRLYRIQYKYSTVESTAGTLPPKAPIQGLSTQKPGNFSYDGVEPEPESGTAENDDICLLLSIVIQFLYVWEPLTDLQVIYFPNDVMDNFVISTN
jgi:hypothetical protein